jgi:TrkA domain protein
MARGTHQPRIARSRLPGIGDRTEIITLDGSPVAVVERHDGTTDLQVGSGPTARLSEADTRSLGAVLAGTFSVDPSLLEDMGAVLGGLRIDATRIDRDGPLAGRSIGELEIRARHAVTVVAVLHGHIADVAPGPATVLEPGARVVVIGRPPDIEDFLAVAGRDHGT